jgi:3',5'-cyclic AMP phosphodiesterase CpdA
MRGLINTAKWPQLIAAALALSLAPILWRCSDAPSQPPMQASAQGDEQSEVEGEPYVPGATPDVAPDVAIRSGRPSPDGVLRFAVVGDTKDVGRDAHDMGEMLAREADAHGLDAILTVGDNLNESTQEALRSAFLEPFAPTLERGIPWYAALGNHDLSEGSARFVSSVPEFHMDGRRYYAVSLGASIEAWLLDSMSIKDPVHGPEQLDWLEASLTGSTAPVKMVLLHHPIAGFTDEVQASAARRELLEPILRRHGVQLVFQGHWHFYQRLVPENGIRYFIVGPGSDVRRRRAVDNPEVVVSDDDHVSGMIWELRGRRLTFASIASDGTVLDQGEIDL